MVFREESEKSDYENGKGSVIGYTQAKLLKEWKERVEEIIGEKDLECEGNRYYDLRKCGIGFHGDGERKKVIGGNFGGTRKIVWIWYQKSQRISERQEIILENGDMYIMSEKSSGFDWKKRSLKTLRHAAGCLENSKFLK